MIPFMYGYGWPSSSITDALLFSYIGEPGVKGEPGQEEPRKELGILRRRTGVSIQWPLEPDGEIITIFENQFYDLLGHPEWAPKGAMKRMLTFRRIPYTREFLEELP